MPIDPSIYGQLQPPQPTNILGMGMSAAMMANAMNQNRMFNLQLQARQGFADIFQKHSNPDGSIDMDGALSEAYRTPATAMFAKDFGESFYKQGLLDAQTRGERLKNNLTMTGNFLDDMAPLIAMHNPLMKDASNYIHLGLGLGHYDLSQASQLYSMLHPDGTDAQGNPTNPWLKQQIMQMMQMTQQSQKTLQQEYGDLHETVGKTGSTLGTFSPAMGYQPRAFIQNQDQVPSYNPKNLQPGVTPTGQTTFAGPPAIYAAPPGGGALQPSEFQGAQGQGTFGGAGAAGQAATNSQVGAAYPAQGPAVADGPNSGVQYIPGENPALDNMIQVAYAKESSSGANPATSSAGAVGGMQIIPPTFAQYARKGEDPGKPQDNFNVGARILTDYFNRYQGDPGRVATAYFSGDKNVAPPGSPTPYINDAKDTDGTPTSAYVADFEKRLGQTQAGPGTSGSAMSQSGQGAGSPIATALHNAAAGSAPPQVAPGQTQTAQASGAPPGFWATGAPPDVAKFISGEGPIAEYQKRITDQIGYDNSRALTIKQMHDVEQQFKQGRFAEAYQQGGAILSALGLNKAAEALVGATKNKDGTTMDGLSASQVFEKLATQQAMQGMSEDVKSARGYNRMLEQTFLNNNPKITMQPGAIDNIFNFYQKIMSLHQQELQHFTDWIDHQSSLGWPKGFEFPKMIAHWRAEMLDNKQISMDQFKSIQNEPTDY